MHEPHPMNSLTQFMKRNYKIILVMLLISAGFWSFKAFDLAGFKAENTEKDKILLELLAFVIERGHYEPIPIDDAFSKGLFKDYVEGLDPSRRFFLDSDIEEFKRYELFLDDQIKNKDLAFFELTYNRLTQRMEESKAYYREILAKPFDYKKDEEIDTDYENLPYAQNKAELKERWRKQIKFSTLASLIDKIKLQEGEEILEDDLDDELSAEKPKKEEVVEIKSFDELEKETRESSLKSLDDYFSFIQDLDRNDWFGIFVNAIASRFDPHTNYMAPDDKERFDVSMSGRFEGIGARLQKKNDFTEIMELISGGPAWRDKQLEPGDILLKVGQGSEEPIDVIGMRLDNIVKKIKGPKGTEVRLTVKKVDGSIKVISLLRDVVETEETYAKSSIVNKNGAKYGIIYLPKFYIDFENNDNRDAFKDVALEVSKLKKEGVEGIIMDVRNNGGGSLKTVVDITGLFIEQGPVVQVKSTGRSKEVLYDKDTSVQWDGPLVILVNQFSASASEILAAAIQDYNRGIIIGSKQTYGKGTVQNVIDLNRFVRGNTLGDLGALKTTTQKFYRINGGSTQLEGVHSDIVLPDRYSYIKVGERDMDNAMAWSKIDPAAYKEWSADFPRKSIVENSKKRLAQNEYLKLIDENARWISDRREQKTYPLHLEKFRAEQKRIDETNKKFRVINAYKTPFVFEPLPSELEQMNQDDLFKEKRNRWFESMSKDFYIEEALNVLNDLKGSKTVSNDKKGKKSKTAKS
jgi:carboxyl-terminal processing protease